VHNIDPLASVVVVRRFYESRPFRSMKTSFGARQQKTETSSTAFFYKTEKNGKGRSNKFFTAVGLKTFLSSFTNQSCKTIIIFER
jgi:hypothetical protein